MPRERTLSSALFVVLRLWSMLRWLACGDVPLPTCRDTVGVYMYVIHKRRERDDELTLAVVRTSR